jgi:pyruvate formate lyase activating enzyme
MQGKIFNIQRFCVNDGPGIRTTVFFKGCPLQCVWCHNPESQNIDNEILFRPNKCTHCGTCKNVTVNTTDFHCPNTAKEICGKRISSDEIIIEALKDFAFYKNSGGGITLSGGEPLLQFSFALEILQKAKANRLHTAIETCGVIDTNHMIQIAKYTDLFLFDYKESDPQLHKAFTGVDNALILENLSLLNGLKKDIILRCPIIPGYNDRYEHYDKIAELADMNDSVIRVEIEPYHSFGESKYTALGKVSPQISTATEMQINAIMEYLTSKTSKPIKRA